MFDPDLVSSAGPGDQYLHNLTISHNHHPGHNSIVASTDPEVQDNCVLPPAPGAPDILLAYNYSAAVTPVTREAAQWSDQTLMTSQSVPVASTCCTIVCQY